MFNTTPGLYPLNARTSPEMPCYDNPKHPQIFLIVFLERRSKFPTAEKPGLQPIICTELASQLQISLNLHSFIKLSYKQIIRPH